MQETYTQVFGTFDQTINTIGGSSTSTYTVGKQTNIVVRSGVDVPGWAYKIAHLQSATSSYTRNGTMSARLNPYVFRIVWNGGSKIAPLIRDEYWRGNSYLLEVPMRVGSSTTAVNTALGNFLTSASNALAPLKGGVILGELRETLRMIKNPASALRDSISSYLKEATRLRRTSRMSGRRLSKVLSNTYLEYVYGWRPLCQDIKSGADAYSALASKQETCFAFGRATDRPYVIKTSTYGGKINTLAVDFMKERSSTFKATYKGVAASKLGIQTDAASRIMVLSGFNWEDFLPTAWELIPYSFVADYFTNISQLLNSAHGLSASWIWKSLAVESTYSVVIYPKLRDPGLGWRLISKHQNDATGQVDLRDYSRGEANLHLPTFQLEIPGVGFVWANLLALLTQRVSR